MTGPFSATLARALSLIRHFDLLPKLYERVLIPDAVLREVVESGAGRAGLISAVRPLLEEIRRGYYLSERLIERACAEAGE